MIFRNRTPLSAVVVGASLAGLTACGADATLRQLELTAAVASALGVQNEDLQDLTAPALDLAALALFQDECDATALDALNADDRDFAAPTAPALPEVVDALPPACDVEARTAAVIAACGPLTPSAGVGDLADRIAGCAEGTTCHIQLEAGDFSGGVGIGCAILEGQGENTRIHGHVDVGGPAVIARVAIDDAYGAVGSTADLLVTDALLLGGYEGLGISWDADIDVAVCRSRVAAGYGGVGQSWGSKQLTVAGSAVAACYEAVASSWGSENLHAQNNVLLAGYVGAHIHHSLASAVVGNTIFGAHEAVSVSQWDEVADVAEDGDGSPDYTPRIVGVLISDNTILWGSLPASDPENDILVNP